MAGLRYSLVLMLVLLALIVCMLPFSRRPRLPWLVAALIFFLSYELCLVLPLTVPSLHLRFGTWNWSGKALAILASLCWLPAFQLSRAETGLHLPRSPRAWTAAILGTLVLVTLSIAECAWNSPQPYTAEHLVFEATMPGLDEELAYRGVLFALLRRGLPGKYEGSRSQILSAIPVTALFWMAHVLSLHQGRIACSFNKPDVLLASILFMALRLGSGSTFVCAAAHNLDNVANVLAGSVL